MTRNSTADVGVLGVSVSQKVVGFFFFAITMKAAPLACPASRRTERSPSGRCRRRPRFRRPSFCPRNRRICRGSAPTTSPVWSRRCGNSSSPVRRRSNHTFNLVKLAVSNVSLSPRRCACRCRGCFARCQSKSSCFQRASVAPRAARLKQSTARCLCIKRTPRFDVPLKPPSSVPNSSSKSVSASRNSIMPCAGIAICDRGPPLAIVCETCSLDQQSAPAYKRHRCARLTLKKRPREFSFRSR